MAQVAVLFKIYPKDGETGKVMEGLKAFNPSGMQTDDVGFGIQVIKALFSFDDATSSSSQLEEKIKNLAGVSEVEVEEESLV